MAGIPPAGPLEVVFSFDTTGSMYRVLDEVRGHIQNLVQRLQADIPGLRIAIFAHGDYCDARSTYVTKHIDFTQNVEELCNFVKNVERTGGGDSDECYELVLHEAQHKLSWQQGSQRAFVMIGDSKPHEPNYPANKKKLDWRVEADNLAKMGVRIYAVQCSAMCMAADFYKSLADRTDGRTLALDNIQNIFDTLMAICYRERGEDFLMNYEEEVKGRRAGAVHPDVERLFSGLRDDAIPDVPSPSLTPSSGVKKGGVFTKVAVKKCPSLTTLKKAKPRIPASLKKYQRQRIALLRRENVPETNFMLRDCNWSSWQLAVVPEGKQSEELQWKKRSGDKEGYRRKTLFHGKTKLSALYEIAVQVSYRSKLHVVYRRFCKGFANSSNWESFLLRKADISSQIDDVIRKDCSIFIRRLELKSSKMADNVKSQLTRYDYAWTGVKAVRKNHRQVQKSLVTISDNSM